MTVTTEHDTTTITAPDDVPSVVITREFDAPPAAVFRAHTEPELLVRWLGPADLTMTVDLWDCRRGGAYRYVHASDGEEHGFYGSFHDVRAHERPCGARRHPMGTSGRAPRCR